MKKKRTPFGALFFSVIWLRFAELARTKFVANPKDFEIDPEFFEMNPLADREAFERTLWERWESGKKSHLVRREKR